jgi:predicted branched-subunit amino acid permease
VDGSLRCRRKHRDGRCPAGPARGAVCVLGHRDTLFALWTLGTLAGALLGSGIDTAALGLDAAAPAIFLALLWPQLSRERARAVALGAAVVPLGLIPLAPAGLPITAAAAVAILAGLLPARRRHQTEGQ